MWWWRFGQDTYVDHDGKKRHRFDVEAWRWTEVMPGDVVQSRGTYAYYEHEFAERDEQNTQPLVLSSAPVLVLARIPGIPNEQPVSSGYVTFVVLSRHGLLIVPQKPLPIE